MIHRKATDTLLRLARGYPVIAITGPRQSGKTTLARKCFGDRSYVNLEDPDQLDFARSDPKRFLDRYSKGAVFDEIQRCPALFSYLQGVVDEGGEMGRFVLTGSQQFGVLSEITQTLAGRVGILHLLPFSITELAEAGVVKEDIDAMLFKGMYPPLYDREVQPRDWFLDYVNTYVERDVRQLINVRDLSTFNRFVRLCAARTGQLLNYSDLAGDTGVSHNTIRSWLSIMEASYLLFSIQPHYRNFSRRLVKHPKLYFYDTGLVCYLLGIQSEEQLGIHPNRGAVFETWVASELQKYSFNRHQPSPLYFWRDHKGREIDFIIESEKGLIPIEVKSGKTIGRDFFSNLNDWLRLAGGEAAEPYLVYGGEESFTRQSVNVISRHRLLDVFELLPY